MWINGKEWYTYLVPKEKCKNSSLFENCDKQDLIIGYTPNSENYIFSSFKTINEFAKYQIDISEKHFYEVIQGDKCQKPYFDIDISDITEPYEEIKDTIVETIVEVFQKNEIFLDFSKDILVFSSHGKSKFSFHIIVDNYCYLNNVEAKQMFQIVYNKLPENIKPYLDDKIYNKNRQFRIVNSKKFQSDRIKTFQEIWNFQNENIVYKFKEEISNDFHKFILLLQGSLITVTNHCSLISTKYVKDFSLNYGKELKTDKNSLKYQNINFTQHQLKEIEKICSELCYNLQERTGNLFILKRLNPSYCKLCKRFHENENPFIVVKENENFLYIFFNCRRNSKFELLGCIGIDEEESKKIEKINYDEILEQNLRKKYFRQVEIL